MQVLTLDNLSRKESNLQGNMKKTDLKAAQPGKNAQNNVIELVL